MPDNILKNIVANDTSLTSFFEDCFEHVDADKMPWIKAENAKSLSLLELNEEKSVLPDSDSEEHIVQQTLLFLNKIYSLRISALDFRKGRQRVIM